MGVLVLNQSAYRTSKKPYNKQAQTPENTHQGITSPNARCVYGDLPTGKSFLARGDET
jgi:hypothetical protein